MLHTTPPHPPRPLTHTNNHLRREAGVIRQASLDIHILRQLSADERRELRERGVWLNPPLVRATDASAEGYYRD